MLAMVIGADVVSARHDAAQDVVAADDEPQLLARLQRQPYREKVDVHAGDFAGRQLLDPVEAVDRDGVRRAHLVEMAQGHAQAAVGALVLQDRRAPLRQALHHRPVVGDVELFERLALGVQLLKEDEQVHVV